MKYRLLWHYGSYEGRKLDAEEYDTVDDAVKAALATRFGTPFEVVVLVDWRADAVDARIARQRLAEPFGRR